MGVCKAVRPGLRVVLLLSFSRNACTLAVQAKFVMAILAEYRERPPIDLELDASDTEGAAKGGDSPSPSPVSANIPRPPWYAVLTVGQCRCVPRI